MHNYYSVLQCGHSAGPQAQFLCCLPFILHQGLPRVALTGQTSAMGASEPTAYLDTLPQATEMV